MKKSLMYAILILILFLSNAWASGLMFTISPYPDYYEGGKSDGHRIDTHISDGNVIPINGLNINTPTRVGYVPQKCRTNDACKLIITSVDLYVDNVFMNTETAYPYDLKYPASSPTTEEYDYFETGYHVIKAVVKNVDSTEVTVIAKFSWGNDGTMIHQIDDLTLYYFTSNNNLNVSWDVVNGATDYDLYLWSVERKEKAMTANIPQPEDNDKPLFTFKVPRTGHYHLFIRSTIEPLSDSIKTTINAATSLELLDSATSNICEKEIWWNASKTLDELKTLALAQKGICSEWTNAINKETGSIKQDDGTYINKGWWIYAHPQAPTGGSIE